MEQRSCAKGGSLTLPTMCVGTWSFGGGEGDYWGSQDYEKTADLIEKAVECGANFFDTAELYNQGRSEEVLGRVLKERGLREKAVIVSKIPPDACHRDEMRKRLRASLDRLQTTYVDLYMVHWPFKPSAFWKGEMPVPAEAFAALRELQEEGLIRHIGVSNFGPKQLREALACGVDIAVNEISYSLFTRGAEYEVIELCRKHDIGVLAYSPLMQGLLTGKYETIADVPDMRSRTRHFHHSRHASRHGGDGCEEELFKELAQLRALAARENTTVTQLALAWVLGNPAVTSVIAGSRDAAQVMDNVKAVQHKLSDAVYAELSEITRPVKEALGPVLDYYASDADCRSE
eukprot:Rhum_TRINITY_DN5857_c0_g1::Rhum_TRINITY_DN5857_c0_g1_i1::g.18599::m.18599